jgi:hypothetical protein
VGSVNVTPHSTRPRLVLPASCPYILASIDSANHPPYCSFIQLYIDTPNLSIYLLHMRGSAV